MSNHDSTDPNCELYVEPEIDPDVTGHCTVCCDGWCMA